MAIVKLKEVTVTRLNNTGNGIQVTEANESGGKTYKTRFTVWFDSASGLREGDIVSLSGFLGAKVGDPWTGDDGQERRSVEYSINKPRIDAGETNRGTASAPAGEPWANTPAANPTASQGESNGFTFDSPTPF